MSITLKQMREHLHYAPETGTFTRLTSNGKRWKIGNVAGCLDRSNGYIRIRLLGQSAFAHRLAFLYMTGIFPSHEVDHRNGDRADNRFLNLRLCTDAQNKENLPLRVDNKYGFPGLNKRPSGYVVKFKSEYIGLFRTYEQACSAYLAARAKSFEFQPVPRYVCQQ